MRRRNYEPFTEDIRPHFQSTVRNTSYTRMKIMTLIVDHKIYTLTAAERWYVLHADYRFANEYQHDYDIDDSVSDEELAAEQPYPDYDLDETDQD